MRHTIAGHPSTDFLCGSVIFIGDKHGGAGTTVPAPPRLPLLAGQLVLHGLDAVLDLVGRIRDGVLDRRDGLIHLPLGLQV